MFLELDTNNQIIQISMSHLIWLLKINDLPLTKVINTIAVKYLYQLIVRV